jgi:hypothetical protein
LDKKTKGWINQQYAALSLEHALPRAAGKVSGETVIIAGPRGPQGEPGLEEPPGLRERRDQQVLLGRPAR